MSSLSRLHTLLAAAALALGACRPAAPELHGSPLPDPQPAPNFELAATDGAVLRLSDLRGAPVLLFFGYRACPDVCPATLADVRAVFEQLGAAADAVRFVFITVDPARDTPEQLAAHLDRFDTRFIGLSGSEQALRAVWEDYGVAVIPEPPDSGGAQWITHTARLFLIDGQGRLVTTYPFGTPRQELLADLRALTGEALR